MHVKDLSGNKSLDRLIYKISVNDDTKYVKFTPNSELEYDAEINIYKELNSHMKRDIIMQNKILRICNNGIIKNLCSNIQIQLGENMECILTSENSKKIKSLYDDNYSKNKNYNIQYLVTNYDSNYCSLDDNLQFFVEKYAEHPKKFHILLEKLFTTLIHLNHKLGFIHWDLHAGNLLINKETCTDFLLYDFDMSETNLITNGECINRYIERETNKIDIKTNIETLYIKSKTYNEKKKIYGLAGDILMFYFCSTEIIKVKLDTNYFDSPVIKKIVKKIIKMEYVNKNHLFCIHIPTLCHKLLKIL